LSSSVIIATAVATPAGMIAIIGAIAYFVKKSRVLRKANSVAEMSPIGSPNPGSPALSTGGGSGNISHYHGIPSSPPQSPDPRSIVNPTTIRVEAVATGGTAAPLPATSPTSGGLPISLSSDALVGVMAASDAVSPTTLTCDRPIGEVERQDFVAQHLPHV
jgi:hypothetical protein